MDEKNANHLEDLRQLEHLLPIGFAFLLPYINHGIALLLAGVAVLHALYISPRLVRVTTRQSEKKRGFSLGKLFYAVGILLLLLIFPDRLYVVAGVWALLAVGDSISNIVGRRWGTTKLPYNQDKSLAGLIAFWVPGTFAAYLLILWNLPSESTYSPIEVLIISAIAAFLTGLAESLPSAVDDNLVICTVGALSLVLLFTVEDFTPQFVGSWLESLIVNLAAAALATLLRWISVRGTLLAFVFGFFVYVSMGWQAYLLLCIFLFLGSIATRMGRYYKESLRVAEGGGGRRGASNVLCNGIVPILIACFSLWIKHPALAVAYAAAVSAATMDTVATEIGQWIGRKPISPLTFRPVRIGTPGGISLEGTAAGLLGSGAVAWSCIVTHWLPLTALPVIVLGALVGGLLESVIASTLRKIPAHAGSTLNIYNTLMGASVSGVLWLLI
jgi:uncharacterized protein (TIGR00297 family)